MEIKFESFAELIYRLGHPPSRYTPAQIFTSWLNHLQRPLPPHTGKYLFRLLFPQEGSRRRYGLKETKLAIELEKALGLSGLTRWDRVVTNSNECGAGCLGVQVELAVQSRLGQLGEKDDEKGERKVKHHLTLSQVDHLLDKLAVSSWSQLSQSPSSPPCNVIERLYRESGLSPRAMSVLTQIILRDLRPLLCPPPNLAIRNPTSLLRAKTSEAPAILSLRDAMKCWDKRMPGLYREKGDLDWCTDALEIGLDGVDQRGPIVGVNVQIPKCRKARSVEDAMKLFPRGVWAETKHDGYRMQIHVFGSQITIFSKSKRNSTVDRIHSQSIILAALGHPFRHLPHHPNLICSSPLQPPESVILEAELVPFNRKSREGNRGPGIEEFWWLESVIHNPDQFRHCCLIFFDILHLNGASLLRESYSRRRLLLEQVVAVIPGFSQIVERKYVKDVSQLDDVFRISMQNREEGLVLKDARSSYNGSIPWVKLKKDYVPGLGDCVDLVVLGAGWDPDRARELRVDTSVFTTFYVGVLTNPETVRDRSKTPHFINLFTVSYGLDRTQLEIYNENIRLGRWRTKPYDKDDVAKRRLIGLSYTFEMRGQPSVLFEQPLCAEVMGAGFQKIVGFGNGACSRTGSLMTMYELRWPRMMKIFEPRERSWTEALTSRQYLDVARKSLGYGSVLTSSPTHDSLNALWRSSSTIALTDIPDSPSSPMLPPSSPMLPPSSPPTIIKTSPHSPRSLIFSTANPSKPLLSAKRLQEALKKGEKRSKKLKPLSLRARIRLFQMRNAAKSTTHSLLR